MKDVNLNEILLHLTELESKQCFQEESIHQLHSEVYQQQQSIQGLEKTVELLRQMLLNSEQIEGVKFDPKNERPPHY